MSDIPLFIIHIRDAPTSREREGEAQYPELDGGRRRLLISAEYAPNMELEETRRFGYIQGPRESGQWGAFFHDASRPIGEES